MLGQLIDYSAVATKVRAMYSRRLMPEDYLKIASFKRVSEVVAYLRNHPGWRGALSGSQEETRRSPLEAALRHYLLEESLSILHYISREDRFLSNNRVLLTEMEQIMLFLRYARAGRADEYHFDAPPFFDRHSRIHYSMLSKAATYEDMLAAVRETNFYTPLARLPLTEEGFPNYTTVETVMRSHYYRALLDMIGARYHGKTLAVLNESVGVEVDMINIMTLMRVRRYFSHQLGDVLSMLIPAHYKLTPAFIREMYTAATEEDAWGLLCASPYGKFFSSHVYTHIEEYYYQFLYEFNRRALSGASPSVYTPLAYLSLRQVELKNLINVIECVRYGLQLSQAPSVLFGVS
ncbi:MAG: V-type ATPase subunit [Oscillospiraceae bacterium]|jgi:vacuolar-type H+-ATPase subunit C/Vma6|nr:V-type ATPase subunit [Oscillospiraceae bacterium]